MAAAENGSTFTRRQTGRRRCPTTKNEVYKSASQAMGNYSSLQVVVPGPPKRSKAQIDIPSDESDNSSERRKRKKVERKQEDDDSDYAEPGPKSKFTNLAKKKAPNQMSTQQQQEQEEAGGVEIDDNDRVKKRSVRMPKDLPTAKKTISKLRKERVHGKVQRANMKIKYDKLREQYKNIREGNQNLTAELDQAGERNKDLERAFRELQSEQLKHLTKDKITIEPDDVVAEKFASIFRDTKDWARQWSLSYWDDAESSAGTTAKYYFSGPDTDKLASPTLIAAIKDKKVAPKVILNALVNIIICRGTFGRPFGHLRRELQDEGNTAVEDSLTFIVDLVRKDSTQAGNMLRASILRAVDNPFAQAVTQQSPSSREQQVQKMREARCEFVARKFINNHISLFRPIEQADIRKRFKTFTDLVRAALNLSASLAACYPHVGPLFLDNLRRRRFRTSATEYSPHRSLKLREDSGDVEGRDPKEIGILGRYLDLVVEPIIMRSGDQNGVNYTVKTLIRRGVVWVVPAADRIRPGTVPQDEAKTHPEPKAEPETAQSGPERGFPHQPALANKTAQKQDAARCIGAS